jgi:thiamine biosynthesis lipoprotein
MVKGASVRTRVWGLLALVSALLGALVAISGCAADPGPYTAGREVLGTAVTISAWGSKEAPLKPGVDAAFAEMAEVEAELDPYDATSTIAAFNASPYEWHALPPSATEVLDAIERLGVGGQFSPTLFGVTNLYDFGGKGSVPETWALNVQVGAAATLERQGARARFDRSRVLPLEMTALPEGFGPHPGLDFGGAAKGLAIDRAMDRLRKVPGIEGAMISAGSSTQVWGAKSDGEPWRVGIEDPRETGKVLAVIGAIAAPQPLNISTSGDYQLFFERGGVRYHHILDPKTGAPARGLRSLTVYGAMSGMDADILSTALFVMGPSAAKEWAERNKVGLYAVDDRGRVIAVSAPKGSGATFERAAAPTP